MCQIQFEIAKLKVTQTVIRCRVTEISCAIMITKYNLKWKHTTWWNNIVTQLLHTYFSFSIKLCEKTLLLSGTVYFTSISHNNENNYFLCIFIYEAIYPSERSETSYWSPERKFIFLSQFLTWNWSIKMCWTVKATWHSLFFMNLAETW